MPRGVAPAMGGSVVAPRSPLAVAAPAHTSPCMGSSIRQGGASWLPQKPIKRINTKSSRELLEKTFSETACQTTRFRWIFLSFFCFIGFWCILRKLPPPSQKRMLPWEPWYAIWQRFYSPRICRKERGQWRRKATLKWEKLKPKLKWRFWYKQSFFRIQSRGNSIFRSLFGSPRCKDDIMLAPPECLLQGPETSKSPKVFRRGCKRCFGAYGQQKACCTGAREVPVQEALAGDHLSSWSKHLLHSLLTTLGHFEVLGRCSRRSGSKYYAGTSELWTLPVSCRCGIAKEIIPHKSSMIRSLCCSAQHICPRVGCLKL